MDSSQDTDVINNICDDKCFKNISGLYVGYNSRTDKHNKLVNFQGGHFWPKCHLKPKRKES